MTTAIPPNKPVPPGTAPSIPLEGDQDGKFGGFSDKPGQAPAGPEQKDA